MQILFADAIQGRQTVFASASTNNFKSKIGAASNAPEPCRKRPVGATRTQLGKHRRTAFDQARWQPQDRTRLPSSGANCPPTCYRPGRREGLCDPTCSRPGRMQGEKQTDQRKRPARSKGEGETQPRPREAAERRPNGAQGKTPDEGADIPRPAPRAFQYAREIKTPDAYPVVQRARRSVERHRHRGDANRDRDANNAVARDSNARRTKRTLPGAVSTWSTGATRGG